MKNVKALLVLAAIAAFCAVPAAVASDAAQGEWTGYITDAHCGQNGANKDHTADCVEKCVKSGAHAQIWIEADKKGLNLDGFDKVKSLVGKKVTVKGTLDAKTGTIKVDSAAQAK
jgi:hypothetical protein